ncbi:MAG: stage III sporulation protein AA [Lachnospiraceae bacterium]
MRPEEILCLFPEGIRDRWREVAGQAEDLQEIRLRAGMPTAVWIANRESFVDLQGRIVDRPEKAARSSADELEELLKHLCRYSVYAFADEIRQGFLTVQGGHRAGLSGQVILDQDGRIKNMKYIRYLNIRIAHQVRGAADPVIPRIFEDGHVLSTLLISPPGGGKTTMLRDIIRQVSEGNAYGEGVNVSVVDERSEIAGSYLGVSQNDVGIRTDILDGCPKVEGMMLLIRSMAPRVLAVDEIGSPEDVRALQMASGCGCRLLATIHGGSLEEVRRKNYMRDVIEQGLFERYVILDRKTGVCRITGIYDREGKPCISC